MNEEKIDLILEGINEMLCMVGIEHKNNSFVVNKLENLTTRIDKVLNPKKEQSLTDKTKDALGRLKE